MKELIYLDNGATTAVEAEAFEAMKPYFLERYGNSFGGYRFGAEAGRAVEQAREQIAALLGAGPKEIFFTSGGSESDNWALKGVARQFRSKGRHIITTQIEHPAVLNTCRSLEREGFEITRLPVSKDGFAELSALQKAVCEDTILISVMAANNEVGTIQPIAEMGAFARERGILFHTDAVQAAGHIPIDVKAWNVDLLSGSGHKFGGPKGVGFLYMKRGIELEPLVHGGGQERGLRGGTHNVPAIAGMGKAAELSRINMEKRALYEAELRDYFINRVLKEIPGARLNGSLKKRLPGNCNFMFPGVSSESLLIMLDRKGICASAGSACASGAIEPSHVLTALGLDKEQAQSSLRFTLSHRNTKEELDFTAEQLKTIVEDLRRFSPYG